MERKGCCLATAYTALRQNGEARSIRAAAASAPRLSRSFSFSPSLSFSPEIFFSLISLMRDLGAASNRNCSTNYRDCQVDAERLTRERSLIAFLNQELDNGYGTLSWRKRFVILLLSSVLSKVTDL